MNRPSRVESFIRSKRLRTWAISIGIAILGFELVYVAAGNYMLRSGRLLELINKKPEKTHISWNSAVTYLPGFATVEGFTLRSQTKKDQIYLHVVEANARISLIGLAFKTIHIRGVDARDVDFRYRERLDRPPKAGQAEHPPGSPPLLEYFPEIPGYSNPPDPKPEDLYPPKKKKRPWTIAITGADVAGPIRVALNGSRLEGDGSVGGGVTVVPRDAISIHRGRLGLDSTTVMFGSEVVAENLSITSDLQFEPFPAKGAKLTDVIGGISGSLVLAGRLGEKAAVRHEITPGITTFGAGVIDANLKFKEGTLRAGSSYSLKSEAFHVGIMGLDASGSAEVSGNTVKESGEHVTRARISFGEFAFVDPEDQSVDISGTGLEVDARWEGLSLGEYAPASHVGVVLPRTRIHDVSTFNDLIPGESLSLRSGAGEVESTVEVNNRIAAGSLDLSAKEIALEAGGTPLVGDVEVHATLAEGDLRSKEFDLTGTTIRLENIVDAQLSEKKQESLDAWFCDIELVNGTVTFGKPMTARGRVGIKMHDTRPLVATLKDLGVAFKGLSLMPNIKGIDGAMDVDYGAEFVEVDDLALVGEGLEVLGWIHIREKVTNGRLLVDYGILTAGVALDEGKAKIRLAKPRKWFEEQQAPSADEGEVGVSDRR